MLEIRICLQNHVILVQLRVHGVDLTLAISVIERAVDGGRRNPKPRCGDAINHQRYRQASGLLIGSHVGKLRQLLHLVDQPAGPQVQLVRIRVLQRVLVLGAADAVIHRDVLHRVHIKHDTLDRLEARLQPANHIGGADAAHIQRLQVDGHSAAIQRGVRPVRADKRREAIDRRILKNDGCKLLLLLRHGRKGDSLRRLRDALYDARILSGEEPLGDDDIEDNRKHQGGGSY